ncbi:MAG TPA: hypothetical protein VK358_02035 [Longimicrobium sp.]|nr:hypothetical protein [Longimicrobium sp.]
MSTELLEPVVNDGVRLTHFFNGRVLTAEDLRREQDAARDRHRGLAGAVGEGVVRGLEVAPLRRDLPAPTVRITAGLAFNRDGDPVDLPRDVELRLIPAQAETDQEAGLFALCERSAAVSVITNPGFYLLAARPASAFSREQVPMVDLSADGIGSRCGSRYAELGASFSLVPLPIPAGGADAPLAQKLTQLATAAAALVERVRGGEKGAAETELARALSKLRNGMAYWCAGRDAAGPRVVSLAPGAAAAPVPTPLEALRTTGALASCDVPLALLYVTRRQLEWVDMWAVRRAPVPRVGPDPLPLAGPQPAAEAAAAFMQFRDHAASFLAPGSPIAPGQVNASDWFLYLPAAGVLPVASGAGGFVAATFFGERLVNGPAPLAAVRVPALLRGSLEHAPIDLSDKDQRTWLYSVSGLNAPGAPPCILFAGYPVEQELSVLPVRITQVVTAAKDVREGDPLRLRGENFEGRTGGQQVLVDGTPVTTYTVQKDDELQFELPSVPGLPARGKQVLLVVSNRSTSTIRPLMLLPRVLGKPLGEVDVEFVKADPAELRPGERALFRFSVRNRTDRAGPVKLTPDLSQKSWPLEIVPAAHASTVLPQGELGLAAGEERTVYLRIPAVPSGTTATELTVRLTADLGGVSGESDTHKFKVVGRGTQPDEGISTFQLSGANPAGALQGTPSARIINVSAYYAVQAIFDLVVTQPGSYVVTSAFVSADGTPMTTAPSGWAMAVVGAPSETPQQRTFTVSAGDLAGNNNVVTLPLQVQFNTFFFTSENSSVRVRVRVQRQGEQARDVTFHVQRTGWIWYHGYY